MSLHSLSTGLSSDLLGKTMLAQNLATSKVEVDIDEASLTTSACLDYVDRLAHAFYEASQNAKVNVGLGSLLVIRLLQIS